MTKEIIVNAGEMESRVAVLENGRLMELHIERDPKIVGNIYKGRVTKVLKGMDAAFVDIGIAQNAFLSVSDVVPQDEEEEGGGRISRHDLPPITQLLHANQEILVQVVRAPMGTKGARITTRLSIPGRYMVLMLHSGAYVGVSRKIEDTRERQRLRAIANEVRPEHYSIIVRTEAEGKSEEELRQDLHFLLDMAAKLENKAARSSAPALVHGDLNLILRLIRDAFTRDVNRLVVDSESAYESIQELVEMISPHMKSRVFLYNEPLPIFHVYNVESEIDRTMRRKVWLPSGGHLVIDQAEALTAIDVNTGRFVGSVELAETVLTTNLQACEEVARQLRLRDLGGIIVVDFIDMDNPRHRSQVNKAFEEALKRDRAKIKVHSISPLGLVEMTRKRTGESLTGLLTEPCPFCSGIGRIQNVMTMALRLQRDIAAAAVEHPETEAFAITAHPRVVASILGYEGEIHHDLEQYIERPVYLRSVEDFHPNTYQVEHFTLEQALAAVTHLEEGDIVEGRVVNPDPALSLAPLVMARGIYLVVPDLDAPVGAMVKVRVTQTGTSLSFAAPLAEELRGVRASARTHAHERPPILPESILPAYLREERAPFPPREMTLLSPTAYAVPEPDGEESAVVEPEREERGRRRRGGRRGKETPEPMPVELPAVPVEVVPELEPVVVGETAAVLDGATEQPDGEEQGDAARSRRRRRRGGRRNRRKELTPGTDGAVDTEAAAELIEDAPASEVAPEAVEEELIGIDGETPAAEGEAEAPARSRRRGRRGGRRRSKAGATSDLPELEPIREIIPPDVAAEALLSMISTLPGEEPLPAEPVTMTDEEAAALTSALEELPLLIAEVAEELVEAAVADLAAEAPVATDELLAVMPEAETAPEPATETPVVEEPKPKRRRTTRKKAAEPTPEPVVEAAPEPVLEAASEPVAEIMAPEAPAPMSEAPTEPDAEEPAKPKRRRRTKKTAEEPVETPAE